MDRFFFFFFNTFLYEYDNSKEKKNIIKTNKLFSTKIMNLK
jgi:hypothetical protein